MASSGDLTAFGLTFRQHDNRHMQQVLRQYRKLPKHPADRTELYIGLVLLQQQLPLPEIHRIENWLRGDGRGEFPTPLTMHAEPTPGPVLNQGNVDDEGDEYESDQVSETEIEQYFSHLSGSDDEMEDKEENPEESEEENNEVDPDHQTSSIADEDTSRPELPQDIDIEDGQTNNGRNERTEEEAAEIGQHVSREADNDSEIEDPLLDLEESGEEIDEAGMEDLDDDDGEEEFWSRLMSISNDQTSGPESKKNTCVVCCEDYGPRSFPSTHNITPKCNHENEDKVCYACIGNSIRMAVDEGALHRIVCPLCPEQLSRAEIIDYASDQTIARYDYLVAAANPDMVACLAPHCGQSQINRKEKSETCMTCDSCGFKTCVIHMLPWHEGQTCEEFDRNDSQVERLEADEATAKLLATSSMICPLCKQGVTRTEGCDHMQCRCGNEWCFQCMASWDNITRLGATAHAVTCDNHPNFVRMAARQREARANRIAELVHGGPVSEDLQHARRQRNERLRAEMRPKIALAAEARILAMEKERKEREGENEGQGPPKKRKVRLVPAWEEK